MTASAPAALGTILVICAPSGTGKSSLIDRLRADYPNFGFSISYTTRPPRGKEKNGVHYNFISRDAFIAMRSMGEFCEWAQVHDNFYGTAVGPVQEMLEQGQDIVFDIDVQGAAQLRKNFPHATFIFILPPNKTELRKRLTLRATDGKDTIERRMANAAKEITEAHWFDHWVVNDDLETAYAELRAIYTASRCQPCLRPDLESIIKNWS